MAVLPSALQAAPCEPIRALPPIVPLGPQLWWVPSARGDADVFNRGQVVNLMLVGDGAKLWLVGSGPSPAFGQRLACAARQQLGRTITDVVSPWARSELVLGASGLQRARHWGHADVASAMRKRCPHCVSRLRARLGTAATDLGSQPIDVPRHLFHGNHGQLGPFRWWRIKREDGLAVTAFHPINTNVITGHALVWTNSAPDLRDSNVLAMQGALMELQTIIDTLPPALRLMPEQGDVALASASIAQHMGYWQSLALATRQALAAGDAGITPSPMPGTEPEVLQSAFHALNWQRAWRHAESQLMLEVKPAASAPSPRPKRAPTPMRAKSP